MTSAEVGTTLSAGVGTTLSAGVGAANTLTAAWAWTITEGTVLSGACAYPLLELLASAAAGPARDELLAVAPAPLRLPTGAAIAAAVGLWPRADLPLTPRWQALVAGKLTDDRAPLDAWAAEQTRGLIPAMPVDLGPELRLLLASALMVSTAWDDPFTDGTLTPWFGPWARRDLAGLSRFVPGAGTVRVADSPAGRLTYATVHGSDDIDVELVLGEPGRQPGDVVAAAVAALHAPASAPLRDGPGVTVETTFRGPGTYLRLPRFRVTGNHDLLDWAEIFGLHTATDSSRGHFPGIGPEPLSVSGAVQAATATFDADGFQAAAITALAFMGGDHRDGEGPTTCVAFDRPFGFLAVHRPTGLVLFAGWVSDPDTPLQ